MQFSGSTVCHETLTVKWTDFGSIDTDISIPHSLLSYLPRMDHMQLREVLKTEDSWRTDGIENCQRQASHPGIFGEAAYTEIKDLFR